MDQLVAVDLLNIIIIIHTQEYISNESVELLQIAFLHIDIMNVSINTISGGVAM